MSRFARLITQIHQRSLWQVLLVYVGSAWACFELIDAVTDRLGLPAWLPGLAIVLFLLGLPFVIATALVREETTPTSAEGTAAPEAGSLERRHEAAARHRRWLTWRNALASFVVALAIWGIVATGWLLFGESPSRAATAGGARPSVAALPFVNLSGREEDAYFSQGIHGEILTNLQKIGGLKVISRTSVMGYRDNPKNVREIGRELDVGYLLEGEILRGAGEVRVNVQLIDARTDEHVWAETYDRELSVGNLLDVQSDIAQRVARALRAQLTPEEQALIETAPTENLDAYQAYLRGRYFMNLPHFTVENLNRAFQEFQRAAELDSTFALVHAEIAKAHAQRVYFWVDASEQQRQLATGAVQQAVRMDPESPHVRLALGLYHLWVHRDGERALEEIARAQQGLPNSPSVYEARAWIYELQGRFDEAIEVYQEALQLDPKDAALHTYLAFNHWLLRQYDRGVASADQAVNLAPDQLWPNLAKVLVIWSDGGPTRETEAILEALPHEQGWVIWGRYWQRMLEDRYAEAISLLADTGFEWIRLKTWARPKALLAALTYRAMGRPEAAQRLFDEARRVLELEVQTYPQDPRYHSSLGLAYAGLGRKRQAVAEGRRAVELLPRSRDAFYGLPYLWDLAAIHAMVGEEARALDVIEELLTVPSWVSPSWLEFDFRLDPLHENPRLQVLQEEYR